MKQSMIGLKHQHEYCMFPTRAPRIDPSSSRAQTRPSAYPICKTEGPPQKLVDETIRSCLDDVPPSSSRHARSLFNHFDKSADSVDFDTNSRYSLIDPTSNHDLSRDRTISILGRPSPSHVFRPTPYPVPLVIRTSALNASTRHPLGCCLVRWLPHQTTPEP